MNNVERINCTDIISGNRWPLWGGTIGLEVVPDASAQAYFDDIEVYGVVSPDKLWIRTGGPLGGLGYDVRFGETTDTMYVTDNYSGVFKSSDNGQSWYPANNGITGRFWPSGDAIPVFTLNLDVNDTHIVWAGLKDVKGVFKSIDEGQTWVDKTPILLNFQNRTSSSAASRLCRMIQTSFSPRVKFPATTPIQVSTTTGWGVGFCAAMTAATAGAQSGKATA